MFRFVWGPQAVFQNPKPYESGQGWQKTEEGFIEPLWSCGPILPPSLVDLLQQTVEEGKDDEVAELHEADDDDFAEDEN